MSETRTIGEKTKVTLQSVVIVGFFGLVPLTVFLAGMNGNIGELKELTRTNHSEVREMLKDHECRLRDLEKRKP